MRAGTLIVGLGSIGAGYDLHLDPARFKLSHARAFSTHPDFELIAGVDISSERRRIFEGAYGVPAFSDIRDAVLRQSPDVVVIAVPTASHQETLQTVLSMCRPLAVLCEKPLADSVEAARAVVQHCAAGNVPLFVNYIRRADPATMEVKRRIACGEIAMPLKGVAWYTKGLLHNGSHFIDLLQHWLGPIRRSAVLDEAPCRTGRDPELDIRLVFECGTVVMLAISHGTFSHFGAELMAPNGRLRYEDGGDHVIWQAIGTDPTFADHTTLSSKAEKIPSDMERYQWNVANQLAMALNGGSHDLCTGTKALAILETIDMIIGNK